MSITIVVIVIQSVSGSRNPRNATFIQNHKNKSTVQNEILETFMSMKMDAECNENVLTSRFLHFYKYIIKCRLRSIRNRRVRIKSRTDLESATFETLEAIVTFSVPVLCTSENR